jgi:hypothetical protein
MSNGSGSEPQSPTALAATAKGSPVFLWDVGPMRYSRNRTAVSRLSSNLHAATSSAGVVQHHSRKMLKDASRDSEPHPSSPRATSESSDREVSKLVEHGVTMASAPAVDTDGSHNSSPRTEESRGMESPVKNEEESGSPHRVCSLLVVPTSKHSSTGAFEMRRFFSGRLSVSFGFDPEEGDDDDGQTQLNLLLKDDSPNKALQHERRSFLTRAMLDNAAAAAATNEEDDANSRPGNDTDSDDVSSVSAASRNDDDDDEAMDAVDEMLTAVPPPEFNDRVEQAPMADSQQSDLLPDEAEVAAGSSSLASHEIPTAHMTTPSVDHKSTRASQPVPPKDDAEDDAPQQLTSMSSFYSRVMQSYRNALEGGAVVLEHNPFHAHLTPQHLQGDAAMYDEENMQKRLALQHSPATNVLLQAVWDAMPKISDGKKSPNPPGALSSSSRSTSRPRALSTSQNPAGGASPSTASFDSATPPPIMGSTLSARGSVDPLAASARSSEEHAQVITYNIYRAMSAYVFRRLVPSGNVDEFLTHCAIDWKSFAAPSIAMSTASPPTASSGNTSLLASIQKMLAPAAPVKGAPPPSQWVMNKTQFFKAMFSVVDVWTESADAGEYHDFMHRVLLKQAKKISDIDPHAFFDVKKNVFASGAFRKRRVKKEVRRVSRTPQRSPATDALALLPAKHHRDEVSSSTPPSLALNVFVVERSLGEASHPVHERAKDKLRSAIDKALQPQKRRGTRFMSVFHRLTDKGSLSRESDPSTATNEDDVAVNVQWTGLTPEATLCPMYSDAEGRQVFNLEELCAAITVQDERVPRYSTKVPPSVVVVDDDLIRDDAFSPSQQLPVLTQRNGSRMIVASASRIDEAMEQLAEEISAHVLEKRAEVLDELPLVETPPDHELQHISLVGVPEILGTLDIPTASSPVTSGTPHLATALPPPQLRNADRVVEEIEDKTHAIAARQKESITTLGGPTPSTDASLAISTFAIAHHSLKGKKFVRAAKPQPPQTHPPQHSHPARRRKHGDEAAPTSTDATAPRPWGGDDPAAGQLATLSDINNGAARDDPSSRASPHQTTTASSPPSPARFARRQPAPSHHSTRGPRPPKFRYETAPSALVAKRKHYRQECGEVIAKEILDEGLLKRRAAENARARQHLIDSESRTETPSSKGAAPSSARTQASTTDGSIHPQEQLVSAAAAKNPRLGVLPQGVRGNLPPGALRVVRTVMPRIVADTKSGKIIVVAPDVNAQHVHRHHRGPIPPAQRGPGRHPVQLKVYEHYDRPYLDRILTHPDDDHQPPSALREEWRAPKQRPGETLEAILCSESYKYPKSMTALARAAIQEYESAVEHLDHDAQHLLKKALPTQVHQMVKYVISQRQSERDHEHEGGGHKALKDEDGDVFFGQESLAMQIAGLVNQQNPNLLLLALLSAKQREELDAKDCNRSRARSLGHLEGHHPAALAFSSNPPQGTAAPRQLEYRGRATNDVPSTIPTLPPIASASPRQQQRVSQDGAVVVVRSPTSDSMTPIVSAPPPPVPQLSATPPQHSLLVVSAEELVNSARRSAAPRRHLAGSALSSSSETPMPSWDRQMDSVVAASHFSPALHRGHLSTIPGRHANSVLAKYNDHQQSSHRWSSNVTTTTNGSGGHQSHGEELGNAGQVVIVAAASQAPMSVLDRPNLFRAQHNSSNSVARGGSNVVLDLQRRKERNDPTLDPSLVAAAYAQLNAQLVYEIEVSEDTQRKECVQTVLAAVENAGTHSRLRQHAAQAGRL